MIILVAALCLSFIFYLDDLQSGPIELWLPFTVLVFQLWIKGILWDGWSCELILWQTWQAFIHWEECDPRTYELQSPNGIYTFSLLARCFSVRIQRYEHTNSFNVQSPGYWSIKTVIAASWMNTNSADHEPELSLNIMKTTFGLDSVVCAGLSCSPFPYRGAMTNCCDIFEFFGQGIGDMAV